uniref:Dedicator of cytokinesis protein 9-like n=1 Tax=Saccoglossus kowalevskii TaxID=10224 RepID=A0ABM0M607_SACKO
MSRILLKYKENREDSKLSNFYLATFIKDCFTYMDRGVIFKLINIYADYFNPGDHKILLEMKFEFYKVVCNHEHFIALNLPLQHKGKIQQFKDLQHDYCLTDEFCRNHFLVGLLLREISCGLHETKESRKCAISVLRNLLVKHSFDDRYKSKAMQARIASLYLPFISVILENAPRLNLRDQTPSSKQSTPQSNGDTPTMTPDGSFPSHVMPSRSSMSLDSGQLDNTSYSTMPSITKTTSARDSSVLDLIAGNKGIVPLLSGSTPGICSGDNMSNSNNQGIRRSSFSI